MQENEPELPGLGVDCGLNAQEPFARYDPSSQYWKMLPHCETGGVDSAEFSQTWPRSGLMLFGTAFRCPSLARPITATEFGSSLLPTPSGVNGGRNHTVGRLDEWGGSSNPFRGTEIGKVRCASFEEWMMGLPIGWTELTL